MRKYFLVKFNNIDKHTQMLANIILLKYVKTMWNFVCISR